MAKKPAVMNYYNRLPKGYTLVANMVTKLMEKIKDPEAMIRHYFGRYWSDFRKCWSHETIMWETFALSPNNAHWFIVWVFREHPGLMKQLYGDIIAANPKMEEPKITEWLDELNYPN